jgi:hypothetical protein
MLRRPKGLQNMLGKKMGTWPLEAGALIAFRGVAAPGYLAVEPDPWGRFAPSLGGCKKKHARSYSISRREP